MSIIQKYSGLLLVAACFTSPAFAQHNDHHGNGNQSRGNNNSSNGSSNHQSYSSPTHQNSSSYSRPDRQSTFNHPTQNSRVLNRGGGNSSSSYNHDRVSGYNNSYTRN